MFLRELTAFLAEDRLPELAQVADDVATVLSPRELDILGLAARGHDNDAIATELVLSVRTVERHLQNAYAKLGLHGRTARTAAVARLLSRA
jgi:DNA-binding NarL/FixJ family response regulator